MASLIATSTMSFQLAQVGVEFVWQQLHRLAVHAGCLHTPQHIQMFGQSCGHEVRRHQLPVVFLDFSRAPDRRDPRITCPVRRNLWVINPGITFTALPSAPIIIRFRRVHFVSSEDALATNLIAHLQNFQTSPMIVDQAQQPVVPVPIARPVPVARSF